MPAPSMHPVQRGPTNPLTYDVGNLSEYICQVCLYPPCASACGKERPTKHRGRCEYNVLNMPAWYCRECGPGGGEPQRRCPHRPTGQGPECCP